MAKSNGANAVKDALRKLGWSQNRLAKRLGVSKSTVSRWVNGSRGISPIVTELLGVIVQRERSEERKDD